MFDKEINLSWEYDVKEKTVRNKTISFLQPQTLAVVSQTIEILFVLNGYFFLILSYIMRVEVISLFQFHFLLDK